ncbi:peptidoglycan DD-metalloendopeptidase family protein [Corynebacterium sp. CCUG 69979]|uniref:peptidoglycan DD-metalloendopeptidase family protein n=1 Tax=Corynebacterium sp. CCUG 69979 TaxID=2823890 RepID=UPI00210DDB23|nr:peptidoglycan DD-metalloendopeptidase family protein [Corynebacterium sp. CCUG 69979]MCQ4626177.1 peptidoglycan DD-metalloendopeptidase family protein [Corynebacterium sp. CCUG 69979]
MKRLGCGLLVLAVAVALLVTVILSGGDGELDDECGPTSGSDQGPVAGGVPDGEFSLPSPGTSYPDNFTSGFGPRWGEQHNGADIANGLGTPIFAYADGVVVASGPASGFGQWIVIDHDGYGEFFSTVYGHMYEDGLRVKVGDQVKAGQHIADEGSNGFSTGAHLHFEVWPGGRLSGGHAVDPVPWLDKAVPPGSAGDTDSKPDKTDTTTDNSAEPSATSTDTPPSSARETDTDELRAVPEVFNEDKMQVDAVRLGRAVAQRFPQIKVIGGWRPYDGFDDHPSGTSIDIMIDSAHPDQAGGGDFSKTNEGRELGDEIRDYIMDNKEEFNLEYIMWRQKEYYSGGEIRDTPDRGSHTANHYDHLHVRTTGGGLPSPDQKYGAAPEGGNGSRSMYRTDCVSSQGDIDADLGGKGIPPGIERMIPIAARQCDAVTEPLLAGLMDHESINFTPRAVSEKGAQGWAQFIPETWATYGAEVDNETGEVIGPPGSGSPHDEEDATIASAKFLCTLDEYLAPGIESGQIKGDRQELILAAYNAGPGAVEQYGGVPPYTETQNYVKIVPETAKKYEKNAER